MKYVVLLSSVLALFVFYCLTLECEAMQELVANKLIHLLSQHSNLTF